MFDRTSYTNKAIKYIIDDGIIEYDIKSAGFNICKQFNLLDKETIEKLELLDKKERHITLGKLQLTIPSLTEKLKLGFQKCREAFFKHNMIFDSDILSIKKDAIFVINKKCKHLKFGKYIEFIPKHIFHSYLYLNNNEFYIGDNDYACKGIKDELLHLHEDYMIALIIKFTNLLRLSSKTKQIRFITNFSKDYRNRELEVGFYRELNNQSLFRPITPINIMNNNFGYTEFELSPKYLDISYNYSNYLVPLYQILV